MINKSIYYVFLIIAVVTLFGLSLVYLDLKEDEDSDKIEEGSVPTKSLKSLFLNYSHVKSNLEIAMEEAFKKYLVDVARTELASNKMDYERLKRLEQAGQMFDLPVVTVDQYIEWLNDWVEQGNEIKYCTICPYQSDNFRYSSSDITVYPLYGFDSMIILFQKGCLPGTSNPAFDIGRNTVLYWTESGEAAKYGLWEPEAGEKVFNRIRDYAKMP